MRKGFSLMEIMVIMIIIMFLTVFTSRFYMNNIKKANTEIIETTIQEKEIAERATELESIKVVEKERLNRNEIKESKVESRLFRYIGLFLLLTVVVFKGKSVIKKQNAGYTDDYNGKEEI